MPTDRDLLTVAEAAGMCRVSNMTIYRLVHSGELPAVRIGHRFRIPVEAARALMTRSA